MQETICDFKASKPNKIKMFVIYRLYGCSLFGVFESNLAEGRCVDMRMFGLFGLFVSIDQARAQNQGYAASDWELSMRACTYFKDL